MSGILIKIRTIMRPHLSLVAGVFVGILGLTPMSAYADAAAEMAKKLQNPLANIKAVMTDNAIGFNTGDDEGTSYGFQIQPVYAIDMPEHGFTFIPRAVIPIMGLEPETLHLQAQTRFGVWVIACCSSSLHHIRIMNGNGESAPKYRYPPEPRANFGGLTGVPDLSGYLSGIYQKTSRLLGLWLTNGLSTANSTLVCYSR